MNESRKKASAASQEGRGQLPHMHRYWTIRIELALGRRVGCAPRLKSAPRPQVCPKAPANHVVCDSQQVPVHFLQ